MEELLNFSQPVNVRLLEDTIQALNSASQSSETRAKANNILTVFKESPSSWQSAGVVLEQSKDVSTKFFALQILEDTIKFRWNALPKEERQGIRNYVVKKIIEVSEQNQREDKLVLNKLNLILVHILKHEWPKNWPSFIPEIVQSSRSSEILCENNMKILKLLSEEVFDFSKEEMTSDKVHLLKNQLNSEFRQIFELCQLVLNSATRPGLATVTLQTLLRFLVWIPLGYVFETDLVDQLLTKYLPNTQFCNDALSCLTEIVTLQQEEYDDIFDKLFHGVMKVIYQQIPPDTDIPLEYSKAGDYERAFIRGLSLYFSGYYSSHLDLLELPENREAALQSLFYFLSISLVDDEEIFNICLEFWARFARSLYNERRITALTSGAGIQLQEQDFSRVGLYGAVLSRLRAIVICKMAKPEEVLIVEDDDGSVVRETTKDTATITKYKTMRDILVYLTHLDCRDTENIMLDVLARQVEVQQIGHDLNSLCWAVGAISGAIVNEEDEKRFLMTVLKDLLSLTESVRGKEKKAIVASNIMFVVRQYPRFLRSHWKFLKTVVNKLFEFMHELHPGVHDMACDTFLKISQTCGNQFVVTQSEEPKPYLEVLIESKEGIMKDLSKHQIYVVYESLSFMIRQVDNANTKTLLLEGLMKNCNSQWGDLMRCSLDDLNDLNRIQLAAHLLKINCRVCASVGICYKPQMMMFYLDTLKLYQHYSEIVNKSVQSGGAVYIQHANIKVMQSVKVETLSLVSLYVSTVKRSDSGNSKEALDLVPPLLSPVMNDYRVSLPETRSQHVVVLVLAFVNALKSNMDTQLLVKLLDYVFNSTLEMITTNFVNYPEHRRALFLLIKSLNKYCFEQLFTMLPAQAQQDIVNTIVWSFKHTDRSLSEIGLQTFDRLIDNVVVCPDTFAQPFYAKYFISLLQDLFSVLTDRLHAYSFQLHASILQKLFKVVQQGQIKVSLYDGTAVKGEVVNNRQFVQTHVCKLFIEAFPNVDRGVIETFVVGLFDEGKDFSSFKSHLRDFLIRLKEFSTKNEDLFAREKEQEMKEMKKNRLQERAQVPGLLTEKERDEMDDL